MEPPGPDSRSRVLIAGAGPVGLAAALRLAQLGVPALVLERRMQLSRALKACAWLPPTLELFERLGVLEGLLTTGLAVQRITYAHAGAAEALASFDLGVLADETRFPFRLHLDHGGVAAALAARLAAYPHVQFAFDAEIVGVEEAADSVAVRVQSATGERIERGAWLLAADGADSVVRTRVGLALTAAAPAGRMLEVLTPADLSEFLPGAAWVGWVGATAGWCSLLRMPDVWHVAMPLADEEDAQAALEEPALRARLARFLPFGASVLPLVGHSVLSLRREVAERFAAGRVLLAGDAAHLVQTRVGLNMNCGLHDALAAAETLALALARPERAEALVDEYAQTRRRIALEHLLPSAAQTLPDGPAWEAQIRAIAADPQRARAWLRAASMFDWQDPPPA
ncbi:MAG: FAD-dependent monooxygenase [Nevskia sp.]|nr:FAD-dependent monooxygenase [Nevskia sp.]